MWYNYECTSCKLIEEVKHGMNENPKIVCEICGREMHKKINDTPVHFKGPGWMSPGKY